MMVHEHNALTAAAWIAKFAVPVAGAEASDTPGVTLPLAGLRIAVKDNIDVAGMVTTAACPGFAYSAEVSAEVVLCLVAAVVYFLVVVPYNRLRKKGEVEQAQDTELGLLTEIRNLMRDGSSETVAGPGTGPNPDTAKHTSGDK